MCVCCLSSLNFSVCFSTNYEWIKPYHMQAIQLVYFFSKSSSATWTKVKENGYHFDKVNQFRKGKNLQFSSGVCPTHVFGTICLRVGFKYVRKTITPTMHLGGSGLGGNGSSSHPGRKDLSVCLCFRNKVLVL